MRSQRALSLFLMVPVDLRLCGIPEGAAVSGGESSRESFPCRVAPSTCSLYFFLPRTLQPRRCQDGVILCTQNSSIFSYLEKD